MALSNKAAVVVSPPPQFYIYNTPDLDHSWLRTCERFAVLRHSVNDSNTAEVGVHKVLHRHAARTYNPAAASLFFVPVYEYSSYSIGNCNGTTHRSRMEAAATALSASESYQRHGGADHFFATSAWSISNSPLSLRARFPLARPAHACLGRVHSTHPP